MKTELQKYILVYNSKVKTLLNNTNLESKIKNICENYLMEQLNNDFNMFRQMKYTTLPKTITTWFNFRIKIIDKITNLFLYPPTKSNYPYIDKNYPYFSNLEYIKFIAFQYKNIVFYLLLFLLADKKQYNNFLMKNKDLKKNLNKNYTIVNSLFRNIIIFQNTNYLNNQNIIKKYFKTNININKKFYLKKKNFIYKLFIYCKLIGKFMLYYYYILEKRYQPEGKGYYEAKESYYSYNYNIITQ